MKHRTLASLEAEFQRWLKQVLEQEGERLIAQRLIAVEGVTAKAAVTPEGPTEYQYKFPVSQGMPTDTANKKSNVLFFRRKE